MPYLASAEYGSDDYTTLNPHPDNPGYSFVLNQDVVYFENWHIKGSLTRNKNKSINFKESPDSSNLITIFPTNYSVKKVELGDIGYANTVAKALITVFFGMVLLFVGLFLFVFIKSRKDWPLEQMFFDVELHERKMNDRNIDSVRKQSADPLLILFEKVIEKLHEDYYYRKKDLSACRIAIELNNYTKYVEAAVHKYALCSFGEFLIKFRRNKALEYMEIIDWVPELDELLYVTGFRSPEELYLNVPEYNERRKGI